MKLRIVLLSNDGSKTYGTTEVEVDEYFTMIGAALWDNKYFKSSFVYGDQPDPFPMYEQKTPIIIESLD